MNKKILIISLIVLFIDIITKYIAYMCFQTPINIIGNIVRFSYAINTGAAWSILSNQTILINIISIVILFIVYRYSKHFKVNNRNILAFSLLYGGILGNLLNRLFTNYVIDFIDIKIFNYDYPVFNIADSAIVIGIILLIVAIIKGEDNENKGRNR